MKQRIMNSLLLNHTFSTLFNFILYLNYNINIKIAILYLLLSILNNITL